MDARIISHKVIVKLGKSLPPCPLCGGKVRRMGRYCPKCWTGRYA